MERCFPIKKKISCIFPEIDVYKRQVIFSTPTAIMTTKLLTATATKSLVDFLQRELVKSWMWGQICHPVKWHLNWQSSMNLSMPVSYTHLAMILPTSVFDIVEDADDYYFPPVTGTYLRLSRMVIDFLAVFMTPVFLLFIMHPEWLPESLKFIQINDPVNVPIFLQMLILEFAIDGLKLASVNTPNMLSTPLSVCLLYTSCISKGAIY